MITKKIVIDYDPREYPHIHLVVASDQHFGSAEASIKRYANFLKDNLSTPNSFLLTVGDGLDCITIRDKRFSIGGIDERYLKSDRPDEILDFQVEHFIETHLPYASQERILGLGYGNHEAKILKHFNTNVHRRICDTLGVRNLGYHFLLSIVLRPKGVDGRSRTFKVMGHHGFGGGSRTEGGPLSSFANFAKHYNVDAAFMGHKHDFVYKRIPKVGVKASGEVDHRDFILALTGTFKKTFNKSDVAGWEEEMGFVPRYLRGGWNLRLTPEKDGWIDTKMSEG